MLYKLSRLQLRAALGTALFNKHVWSDCCVQSPAQGVEDSGIPIFKELQPNVPNWGAWQNHLGHFSKGPTPELNQVHRLGPGLWDMEKLRGCLLSTSLDVKLWDSVRGRHVYY